MDKKYIHRSFWWFFAALAAPLCFIALQILGYLLAFAALFFFDEKFAHTLSRLTQKVGFIEAFRSSSQLYFPSLFAYTTLIIVFCGLLWWRHLKKTAKTRQLVSKKDEKPLQSWLSSFTYEKLSAQKKSQTILLIIVVALSIQALLAGALSILFLIFPALLNNYSEAVSDLSSPSTFMIITVSLLAPFAEELFFRGIMLEFLRRCFKSFAVANFVQALFFGLVHGNPVQGFYAFLIGLVAGLLYKKYQNIGLCMILHIGINSSSYPISQLQGLVPAGFLPSFFFIILACGLFLALISLDKLKVFSRNDSI